MNDVCKCPKCSRQHMLEAKFDRYIRGPVMIIVFGYLAWTLGSEATSLKSSTDYLSLALALGAGAVSLAILGHIVLPSKDKL